MSNPNKKIIQSYVYFEDKGFFVSTIERDSSTIYGGEIRYNETIVWEWDKETREKGVMIYQKGCGKNDISEHFEICKQLFKTGKYVAD